MRYFIFTTFVYLLSVNFIFGQCEPQTDQISNNFRENTSTNSGLLKENINFNDYFAPDGEEKLFTEGFIKSIWMGGVDPAGNLRVNGETYALNRTFVPGPFSRNVPAPLDTNCVLFNKIWKVTEDEIIQFKADFESGFSESCGIPASIIDWPAKGNLAYPTEDDENESVISFDLAPFYDHDFDGLYDPYAGDHPIPLQESPDFIPFIFSFSVYNDYTQPIFSDGHVLPVEIHHISYVMNCEESPFLRNSVFHRLELVYFGTVSLHDFRLGIFTDMDLGCYPNDYMGTDTSLNAIYVYNENGEEDGVCASGPHGVPDNNGVIQTDIYLNKKMASSMYMANPAVSDFPLGMTHPERAIEMYNYLTGYWRDGSPLVYGEMGYDPLSNDVVKYTFPGLPTDLTGWSMQTTDLLFGDFVMLPSFGYDILHPGEIITLDFVDHIIYDPSRKKLEIFEIWEEEVNKVKKAYTDITQGLSNCGHLGELCVEDCVFPGDVNVDGIVNNDDILYGAVFMGKIIPDGIAREKISTHWAPQHAENWSYTLQGINAKHGDVNGNGVINIHDIHGIISNRGNHVSCEYEAEDVLNDIPDPYGLSTTFSEESIIYDPSPFKRLVDCYISLGDADNNLSEPIHGIRYDIGFDTNLVTLTYPHFGGLLENEHFPDSLSFIEYGFEDISFSNFESQGVNKLEQAITRLDGTNTSKVGQLRKLALIIKENAATPNPDGRDTLVVKFYNTLALNADGEEVMVGVRYDSLIIENLIYDPTIISDVLEEEIDEKIMIIYPNPVIEEMHISFDEAVSGMILIYDVNQRIMETKKIEGKRSVNLSLDDFPAGMYFVRYVGQSGEAIVGRFVKQ